MTNKELLEAAAKAAGIDLYVWGTPGAENFADRADLHWKHWNPLTDDGDALRLAVKVKIDIFQGEDFSECWNEIYTASGEAMHGDDPFAATRRAIVLAAAASLAAKEGGEG